MSPPSPKHRSQAAPDHRNPFLDTLAFGKAPLSLAWERVVPVAPGEALDSSSREKVSVCVRTPHAHVFVGVTDHRPAPEKGGTRCLSQEAHSVGGAMDRPDSG